MGPERVPRKEGEKANKTRPHYALPTGSTDLRYSKFIFFFWVPPTVAPESSKQAARGYLGMGLGVPLLGQWESELPFSV